MTTPETPLRFSDRDDCSNYVGRASAFAPNSVDVSVDVAFPVKQECPHVTPSETKNGSPIGPHLRKWQVWAGNGGNEMVPRGGFEPTTN